MVVLFSALMLYSEHRAVMLPSGVLVSPGFMVGMASIVAFHRELSLVGPLLVGMVSGLYFPHVRERKWQFVALNTSVIGLATLAAAAAYAALPERITGSMPLAITAAVPAAVCEVVTLWVLLGTAYAIKDRRSLLDIVREFVPATAQFLSFGLVGLLLGRLYVEIGAAALLLIIVPILIAREMFASYLRVKEAHEETVGMLIRALEAKDRYTAGHAARVATYARYIGNELGFSPARMERLRFAALMHDIGKLVVPNQLLNKPGKLTADEFARVRVHERVSVQMLSHIDFLRPIASISHSDTTRFDPDDLDHPIEPYIVMIADAYDAMTSTRSYRKALPQDVAFAELRDKSGVQFHPACVEALIRSVEERGEKHGAGFEEAAHFADAPHAGVGSAGLGDLLQPDGV